MSKFQLLAIISFNLLENCGYTRSFLLGYFSLSSLYQYSTTPSFENTWEPASHFVDPKLVKDYLSMSGGMTTD